MKTLIKDCSPESKNRTRQTGRVMFDSHEGCILALASARMLIFNPENIFRTAKTFLITVKGFFKFALFPVGGGGGGC